MTTESNRAAVQARKNGTAGVFSRASATYDQIGPRFFSYFGQRLVDLAGLEAGASVLDLATGRGAVLFETARQVGPTGRVVGVDLAEGMVSQTAAQVREQAVRNVAIAQMDAEQLAFGSASFDAVLCGFGLAFFPNLGQALAEAYRVLKPGGRLGATGWGKSDERWDWIAEVGLRPKPGGGAGGSRPAHHGAAAESLTDALSRVGFSEIQVIEEEAEFEFADAEEWWTTEWSHGARSCLERLPAEGLAEAKTAAFARLEDFKQANGGSIKHLYRGVFTLATKPVHQ